MMRCCTCPMLHCCPAASDPLNKCTRVSDDTTPAPVRKDWNKPTIVWGVTNL